MFLIYVLLVQKTCQKTCKKHQKHDFPLSGFLKSDYNTSGKSDIFILKFSPRYDLVATELNGALYMFGGKALRLDMETDEWTLLDEQCLDKKFFCGCTTVSGQIYLVSERKSNKAFPNMLLLDPYIDTCLEIDDAIACPVPIRGCVTIRMVSSTSK